MLSESTGMRYGASNHIHTNRLLSLSGDLPTRILTVDPSEKLMSFLPESSRLVTQGLILVEEVDAIQHAIRDKYPGGERELPTTSARQRQRDQASE
jgi:uncharacterized protein